MNDKFPHRSLTNDKEECMNWISIIAPAFFIAIFVGFAAGLIAHTVNEENDRAPTCVAIASGLIAWVLISLAFYASDKADLEEEQQQEIAAAQALQEARQQFAERVSQWSEFSLVPLGENSNHYMQMETSSLCGQEVHRPCVMVSYRAENGPARFLAIPFSRIRVQAIDSEHNMNNPPRLTLTFRHPGREINLPDMDLQVAVRNYLDQAVVECRTDHSLLTMSN